MKILPALYGFEFSISLVQDPKTCPYPQSDRSSPHTLPADLFEIHFNIILQYTLSTSRWSPRRFSHHNPVCTSLLPKHVTRPAHFFPLNLISRMPFGRKTYKTPSCNFLQAPVFSRYFSGRTEEYH